MGIAVSGSNVMAMAVRGKDREMDLGGLLGCCVRTIMRDSRETEVGDRLYCWMCHEWVVVRADGVWAWHR